jgi:hypothetical protein
MLSGRTAWTGVHGFDIRKGRRPFPIVLTHGWPGSIVEFQEAIVPLTDPGAHGGSAEDAFDVVNSVPSGVRILFHTAEAGWSRWPWVRTSNAYRQDGTGVFRRAIPQAANSGIRTLIRSIGHGCMDHRKNSRSGTIRKLEWHMPLQKITC